MKKKRFITLFFASLVCTLSLSQPSSAQNSSPEFEAIKQKALHDLQNIYQHWRQTKPNDPSTYQAFEVYLHASRKPVDIPMVFHWNSFIRKPVKPFLHLEGGGYLLQYLPSNGSDLMKFRVDLNGSQGPNSFQEEMLASQDKEQGEQVIFLIDKQGKVRIGQE